MEDLHQHVPASPQPYLLQSKVIYFSLLTTVFLSLRTATSWNPRLPFLPLILCSASPVPFCTNSALIHIMSCLDFWEGLPRCCTLLWIGLCQVTLVTHSSLDVPGLLLSLPENLWSLSMNSLSISKFLSHSVSIIHIILTFLLL